MWIAYAWRDLPLVFGWLKCGRRPWRTIRVPRFTSSACIPSVSSGAGSSSKNAFRPFRHARSVIADWYDAARFGPEAAVFQSSRLRARTRTRRRNPVRYTGRCCPGARRPRPDAGVFEESACFGWADGPAYPTKPKVLSVAAIARSGQRPSRSCKAWPILLSERKRSPFKVPVSSKASFSKKKLMRSPLSRKYASLVLVCSEVWKTEPFRPADSFRTSVVRAPSVPGRPRPGGSRARRGTRRVQIAQQVTTSCQGSVWAALYLSRSWKSHQLPGLIR